MNISQVAHAAFHKHGLMQAGAFSKETGQSVRYLLDHGLIERRERVVELPPREFFGAQLPAGPTTLTNWHLTDAGREEFMAGRL